ncbi:MAG: hypothetical protein SVX43_04385 [Cyanobacteriota bacterium]|nr:hypothetical protein [Cyanobacteriota bacterium]
MSSGIYVVAHIGRKKLFVSDANRLSVFWSSILAQLTRGNYPNSELQKAWNRAGGKQHFSFHLKQEIVSEPDIIGRYRLQFEQ